MEEPTGLGLVVVVLHLVLAWPLAWAIGYGFGYWILKPLREAALKPPPPTQYRLPDLFVLLGVFFVVGLPFAFGAPSDERLIFAELLFVWSLCAAWWWWGLRLLSGAGITHRWRRVLCLGVAVPLACAGSLAFILWPAAFLRRMAMVPGGLGAARQREVMEVGRDLVLSLPFWVLAGAAVFLSVRYLARWIAKGARAVPPKTAEPPRLG
jgi:hypothetical protein